MTRAPVPLAGTPLATVRYQTWRPVDGVPIRSSVGEPKIWRHGPLIFVRELAPFGISGRRLDVDEAHRRYVARLDRHAA